MSWLMCVSSQSSLSSPDVVVLSKTSGENASILLQNYFWLNDDLVLARHFVAVYSIMMVGE
jgi:hypothetical protein